MALYAINSLLDDLISKQISKYFATLMDSEDGDEKFSDVRVKDGSIVLNNLFAKPETVNRRLALARLPARVAMLHCKNVTVNIPWLHFSTGFVELVVDDLFVILHPTVYERSAEELRATKELEVVKAIRALLKRQQAVSKRKDAKPDAKPPRLGILGRLKEEIKQTFRPRVRINRVHVRYEQFGNDFAPNGSGFALGFVLHACAIDKDDAGDDDPSTSQVVVRVVRCCAPPASSQPRAPRPPAAPAAIAVEPRLTCTGQRGNLLPH